MSVRVLTGYTGSTTNVSDFSLAPWLVLYIRRDRQASVQYQIMEDLYRLFQLFADRGDHRREDIYHARWSFTRSPKYGTNQTSDEADRCT